MDTRLETALLVIGAGPGGYPAAFHAADLGMSVVLADPEADPGGVCLYRGCIPSKALLHVAQILHAARTAAPLGLTFAEPGIDLDKIRQWRDKVVTKLTSGLGELTRQHRIQYLRGTAQFLDSHTARVLQDGSITEVHFEHAILATGSAPVRPGIFPELPGIMDSTGAIALPGLPQRLLVVGAGYIGLELGQVYAAFGSRVSVVEMLASPLPGVDPDLVRPLTATLQRQFENIWLNTRVSAVRPQDGRIAVNLTTTGASEREEIFDAVLVAVGRRPVTAGLGLEHTQVQVNPQGFVTVDAQRRTTDPAIFAVGDITGQPMLAHKATHEGRCAAETIHGGKTVYAPYAIPAVVFTDPEIAWCGLTEAEARQQGLAIKVGVFPWLASGRAATLGRSDGLTKLVAAAETGCILGVGIAGPQAGELIGEGVLAMEMGAVTEDLAMTIHAHPSLSETIMEAAQRLMGSSTHFFQRS